MNIEIMRRFLFCLISICLIQSIGAYDFQIGNLRYSITSTSAKTVSVEASSTSLSGNVVIPSTVTYNDVDFTVNHIAANGFAYCHNITSFTIPNSVKGIGSYGFGWCWYLNTIILDNPSNSFSVGSDAFNYDWRAFKTVRIINANEKNLFNNGAALLGSSSLPTHDLYINNNKIVNYSVVDGVHTINTCLRNCNSIETLSMPNSVKTIVNYACYGCTALNTITLSSKLESIGRNAFAECPELRTIYAKSIVPATIDASTFPNGAYMFATLYIPKGTLTAYKNANIWKNFVNIVEIEYDDVAFEPVTEITITPNSCEMSRIGQTTQLVATVLPEYASNRVVNWASSDESVATVNNNGLVTAVGGGNAAIIAMTTDGTNLFASCLVSVSIQATSINLNTNFLTLNVNESSQLTATVYPSNATNKNVTWKSSNTSVAIVSSSGLVTAKALGTATITATTTDGSNLSASCAVTVSTVPVSSISLNKSYLTLDISETYLLTATITPSNATNKTVTWMSNNPDIATVSSNGLVTPVAPGNTTIIAKTTDGTNLTASCQVTVVKRVTAISLNKNSLTLTLPETAQLIATITPSDATNPVLNWTSSKPSVATVDNNGNVTSVGVGTATIKATTTDGSNLSTSCQITVNKQNVTSITLNESNLVLHSGETYQLIADVQPENASNKTLTWTSGNTSVATVDNNGLVTAVAEGTTYIKAATTDGSYLNASCSIEVLPDYYLTLDTLSHVRGSAVQVMDLPVTLVNKNPISGIQFDVTLPSGIEFNLVDGFPDVWLDDARATRTHSISANQLSNGNYRVLVTSSASKDLKGNDGILVHMNMLLPQRHDTGNRYIYISNIIASEADETRHTLDNTSTQVHFYYIVGDADANASVDIADHAATASKILGKSPSPFYNDAADVDANNSLDVVDLVGITNIALEIKPITIRQAPKRYGVENRLFCDKLHLNAEVEKEITIGMDCDFDFAGFQMDVELPRGLKLVDASIGKNAARLGLVTEMMPDGKIRILGTSFSDAVVDGVCQELLKLKVRANRGYINGTKIEFSDILFAERDLTAHNLDDLSIEYVEPSAVYELMEDARIYVENGSIIVDTPYAGTVQLIAADCRMVEYQAHIGHNVYPVDVTGIYIIHFVNKTVKVLL